MGDHLAKLLISLVANSDDITLHTAPSTVLDFVASLLQCILCNIVEANA